MNLKSRKAFPTTFQSPFLLPIKPGKLAYLRALSDSKFTWEKDTGMVTCGRSYLSNMDDVIEREKGRSQTSKGHFL